MGMHMDGIMSDQTMIGFSRYLLNSGIQWGAAPSVKGVRDAAVELLHTLVAVHAEVFAGAKPLLDKTLGILVEGLIDMFISIFTKMKAQILGYLIQMDSVNSCLSLSTSRRF